MTQLKLVTPEYWRIRRDLKQLLNEPLAGGRGAQRDQDRRIHQLAFELTQFNTPNREGAI